MKWFNILKVLGTKSGFSQLDFDNIVIEDEGDCKERFIEICKKLKQMVEETARTFPEEIVFASNNPNKPYYRSEETEIKFNKTKDLEGKDAYSFIRFQHYYSEIDAIPEEVICRALEMLDDGRYYTKDFVKGYRIKKWDYNFSETHGRMKTTKKVWIDGKEQDAFLGFFTSIRGKDKKYSTDLYDKLSEALK